MADDFDPETGEILTDVNIDRKVRASTTGKPYPVADQTNWRQKLRESRIKFDDEQKRAYLWALREWGQKSLAARHAGVCPQTVGNHLKNDEEFAADVAAALAERSARLVSSLEEVGLNGYKTPVGVDKEGNVVEKKIFMQGLSVKILERHDPEYRPVQKVDLNHSGRVEGGMLVVPGAMSAEEWEEMNRPPEPDQSEDADG